MTVRRLSLVLFLCLVATAAAPRVQAQVPTPEQFAGFRMGEEGKLVRWDKLVEYFTLVDKASDRVQVEELGKTTLGNPFILAIISSPKNLEIGRASCRERV